MVDRDDGIGIDNHVDMVGPDKNMEHNIFETYHLSTEGYYFKYRHDKYKWHIMRAVLFNDKGEIVDSVTVSSSYRLTEAKSHHDVINYFEAGLSCS